MSGASNNRLDDQQVGGDHYKKLAITPWEALEAWLTPEEFRGYLKGEAIVYIAREASKAGPVDISKARHVLQRLEEFDRQRYGHTVRAPVEPIVAQDQPKHSLCFCVGSCKGPGPGVRCAKGYPSIVPDAEWTELRAGVEIPSPDKLVILKMTDGSITSPIYSRDVFWVPVSSIQPIKAFRLAPANA